MGSNGLSKRSARAVETIRLAAADPSRPGEKCEASPGTWAPIVDQSACEGKRDCVDVCPHDVFEVRRIDSADFKRLGLLGQIKVRIHGMQMAYTPRADECRACGLCVVACPEDAIRIERVP
jgi:NAD-dependent dihydropyrimidine dehydrogenase PreA subunit